MAEKDAVQKTLESYNDVFADIVNVLLFNGKRIVKENALTDAQESSYYKMAEGEVRSQERDVAKYWKNGEIRLSFIGLENQSMPEKEMPIRVMGYDTAAYKTQIVEKTGEPWYPVITLVLYFGTERRWKKNLSLKEIVSVPSELEPFVNDFKINVAELAWLTDEQIKLFRSDFREVALFLRSKRTKEPFTGSRRKLKHVMEIIDLIGIMAGERDAFNRIEPDLKLMVKKANKGGIKMYSVLQQILDEGFNRGVSDGFNRGRTEGRAQGEAVATDTITSLFSKLRAAGKDEELDKALADRAYLKKLMDEYQK